MTTTPNTGWSMDGQHHIVKYDDPSFRIGPEEQMQVDLIGTAHASSSNPIVVEPGGSTPEVSENPYTVEPRGSTQASSVSRAAPGGAATIPLVKARSVPVIGDNLMRETNK